MAPKRKRSAPSVAEDVSAPDLMPPPGLANGMPKPQRRASGRTTKAVTNPDANSQVLDGPEASRASPDRLGSDSPLSDVPDIEPPKKRGKAGAKSKASKIKEEPVDAETPKKAPPKARKEDNVSQTIDPEAEGDEEADEEEIKEALSRPPPVHSDYLPLPWKGRLGYVRSSTTVRYITITNELHFRPV